MKSGIRYRFFTGKETTAASPAHMMHIQAAHTLLESVKREKAISDIEQLSRVITMSDGTTIRALSSIGFEDIRITVPLPPPPVPKPVVAEEAEEEKEKEEEKEEEVNEYLWIGIRPTTNIFVEPYADSTFNLNGLCGLLIEPDGVHTLVGEAGLQYRKTLMTNAALPITDANSFNYDHLSLYREDDGWNYVIPRPEGKEPLAVGYRDVGVAAFSASGVIGYDSYMGAYGNLTGVENILLPIDPKLPMEDAPFPNGQLKESGYEDQRDVIYASSGATPFSTHWDSVFLLDPDPSIKDPSHVSSRKIDADLRAVVSTTISTLYGNSIKVKSGKYILKVLAFGYCRHTKGAPVPMEIEVRLGKPEQRKFTTTATIDWWSEHPRAVYPGGSYDAPGEEEYTGTDFAGSPNPHGPMWWQGALEIDVKTFTVKEIAFLAPEPFFGAGTWAREIDACSSPTWPPYMFCVIPNSSAFGMPLDSQAYRVARTWYWNVWYQGDQGWDYTAIDWSRYDINTIKDQILAYLANVGITSLNGKAVIASSNPNDDGSLASPVFPFMSVIDMGTTLWNQIVANNNTYEGVVYKPRIVF